eukprot:Sspe_Gene.28152::Locus_12581_Transcript_2_3_Confidence_0.429_Length_3321::g.28152::m.28152
MTSGSVGIDLSPFSEECSTVHQSSQSLHDAQQAALVSLSLRMADGIVSSFTAGFAQRLLLQPPSAPTKPLLNWLRGVMPYHVPKPLTRTFISELESLRVGERPDRSPMTLEERQMAQEDIALWMYRHLVMTQPQHDLASWDEKELREMFPVLAPELDRRAPHIKHLGLTGQDLLNMTTSAMGEYPMCLSFEEKKLLAGIQMEVVRNKSVLGVPQPLSTQISLLLGATYRANSFDTSALKVLDGYLTKAMLAMPPVRPASLVMRSVVLSNTNEAGDVDIVTFQQMWGCFLPHVVFHWKQLSTATLSPVEAAWPGERPPKQSGSSTKTHLATIVIVAPWVSEGPSAMKDASNRPSIRPSLLIHPRRFPHLTIPLASEVLIPPTAHFQVIDTVQCHRTNSHLVIAQEVVNYGIYSDPNPFPPSMAASQAAYKSLVSRGYTAALKERCLTADVERRFLQMNTVGEEWYNGCVALVRREQQCRVMIEEGARAMFHRSLAVGWLFSHYRHTLQVAYLEEEEKASRTEAEQDYQLMFVLIPHLQGVINCKKLTEAKANWLVQQLQVESSAELSAVSCGVLCLDPKKRDVLATCSGSLGLLSAFSRWRHKAVVVFYIMLMLLEIARHCGTSNTIFKQFSLYEATGICIEHKKDPSVALVFIQLWEEVRGSFSFSPVKPSGVLKHTVDAFVELLKVHTESDVVYSCLRALRKVTEGKHGTFSTTDMHPEVVSWSVRRSLENIGNHHILRNGVQVITHLSAVHNPGDKEFVYTQGGGTFVLMVLETVPWISRTLDIIRAALQGLVHMVTSLDIAWKVVVMDKGRGIVDIARERHQAFSASHAGEVGKLEQIAQLLSRAHSLLRRV